VLDRYQLIGRIATGGMGSVYLARNAGVGGFQRFVAIKRLHPHLAQEPEFVEMFLDEARLAAGIHHPNVVPIHEIGTIDGSYFVVMDYVEGESLSHLATLTGFRSDGFPRNVLLRIVLDTLTGLHAAHEQKDEEGQELGLVHRDCSPQNILVGVDGHSRITDFGIARASSRLATTRKGSVKGKLAYMAPEQVQEEPVDRRTDLFAVGVILWEGLAARRLFKADTEAKTLKRVLMDTIPRLSSAVPKIHPSLDELCAKILQRNPADRFQTALEMADELEKAARAAASSTGGNAIATVREVADFMANVLGEEMDSQRDSIRDWLSKTPPSSRVIGSDAPLSSSAPEHLREIQVVEDSTNPRMSPGSIDSLTGDSNAFDEVDTLVRPSFPAPGPGDSISNTTGQVAIITAGDSIPGGSESISLPMNELPMRKRWLMALLVVIALGAVAVIVFFTAGSAKIDGDPTGANDGVDTGRRTVSEQVTDSSTAQKPAAATSASSDADAATAGSETSTSTDSTATAKTHPSRSATRPSDPPDKQPLTTATTTATAPSTASPKTTASPATTPTPTTTPRVDDDLANPYR